MLSEILTFIFFVLIGLEIREGLSKPKDAALPAIAALGGMAFPALIFIALIPGSTAWAVAMPTDGQMYTWNEENINWILTNT